MFSPLEQFDVVKVFLINLFYFDVSFLNVLLLLILINLFLIFVIFFFKYNLKLIPTVWQYCFEFIYKFIFNIVKQQIGEQGYVYFPFIFVIFNFILLCNMISLFPFGIALTSHLVIILFLSITISLSVFLLGLLKNNLQFLRIFIPQCPFVLLPILIIIEIFSYFIRILSLAIRLVANILAGHTLVYIISNFILVLFNVKYLLCVLFIFPLLAIFILEFGVAFLQAYVFVILVSIYLSDVFTYNKH